MKKVLYKGVEFTVCDEYKLKPGMTILSEFDEKGLVGPPMGDAVVTEARPDTVVETKAPKARKVNVKKDTKVVNVSDNKSVNIPAKSKVILMSKADIVSILKKAGIKNVNKDMKKTELLKVLDTLRN